MQRIYIENLQKHVGKEAIIAGWVDVRRDHGKLIFIDLRDRTGKVQCVIVPSALKAYEAGKDLRSEWVVQMTGVVQERPGNMRNDKEPNGTIELAVSEIEVLSRAAEMPFELGTELNLDTYLDHLPLTLRTPRARDIFTLQATLVEEYRTVLRNQGFTEFQAPGIVGGDAEGGAAVFKVEYLKDKAAYLATSPQFYKQIMVGIFERVFTIAKVFRAEEHATSRHLNEYSTLDFEMGFVRDHHDVMETLEKALRHLVKAVSEKHSDILIRFGMEIPLLPQNIPVMKLREAQEIITKETGEDCVNEPDLEPAHERFLCEYARKNLNSDFLFVTHYPVSKRPFYTYEDETDPGFTKSFDLLFRGVEIVTGGQRIHDYNTLVEKIKAKNLNPEKFSFYLEAFKYGMPPHGGCAIGLERLTQKFLGLENVKEAALFPRDMNRIDTLLSQ
ncbi:aspartate--tRNA(Asn) ligase [Candidatus Kaiserbacteria bacterium RIFCSPHIGHO2_02_FULL_50_9]|uniref:Aspartate--tRNA(Asp/Asn) ligase n=1 Tax=Candidatus Kaiserbacteria bacterium RIFCSPLOWO2_01_FULL_51_21 TaxID=1798508 RepID=A0A1F6EDR7_9BACT|nr:MAG: aspartate--tRNA(Asn) ligase [Candidatus Kaiserbacteria bacterium RIFCSPHIGHO2_01_FULL_51_33]OGG63511.1 MAG: aspartate--tRNA(Asn) ligase [Candidatus Kaiserbacteria bacterium RIFCSPHIGHO2_02_FULL_50_9]OGG71796.1 MAG: aspartate--tRNA(Asn) ligase [Candidatus Kaiserbacteria bacterium RIFCSPLOWO2_01_FULL_51_21]